MISHGNHCINVFAWIDILISVPLHTRHTRTFVVKTNEWMNNDEDGKDGIQLPRIQNASLFDPLYSNVLNPYFFSFSFHWLILTIFTDSKSFGGETNGNALCQTNFDEKIISYMGFSFRWKLNLTCANFGPTQLLGLIMRTVRHKFGRKERHSFPIEFDPLPFHVNNKVLKSNEIGLREPYPFVNVIILNGPSGSFVTNLVLQQISSNHYTFTLARY